MQNFSFYFQILDASYHSSPSLQTSAMILLCSVLLLIIIFVSSILVWKWVQSAYDNLKYDRLLFSLSRSLKMANVEKIAKKLFPDYLLI